jgi:hypothetical protein
MALSENRYHLPRPGAVAWAVLLISFVLFCAFCAASTAVARWFLLESQVDLNVRLIVSKGRVNMQMPDGANTNVIVEDTVVPGAVLQTDSNSQGYLIFEDNYSRQVLASFFILQDSTVTLAQSSRPRFEWSTTPYSVTLINGLGRFLVDRSSASDRGLRIDLRTGAGNVRFFEPGAFRVDTTERQMKVATEVGRAMFMYASGDTATVAERMVGVLNISEQGMQDASASPITADVLNVGLGKPEDVETNPLPPPGWVCWSKPNRQEEPQGSFGREFQDSRVVLRLVRAGEGLDHAETSCDYYFDQPPTLAPRTSIQSVGLLSTVTALDVRRYSSLRLRAKIQINGHDVTTCGVQGSECPIMFELRYRNLNAPEQDQYWRHGFYAVRPGNDTNPIVCDTCVGDHEKLNLGVWYFYESDDLFKLFPAQVGDALNPRHPDFLVELRVYSSGHAYDAIVSDLALVADGTLPGS